MSADVLLGLDVGSTYVKVLAVTVEGEQVGSARRPTPWRDLGEGRTETTADDLLGAVREILHEVVDTLDDGSDVVAVGISGMAEAGTLLDVDDNVVIPIPAWFDPRGGDEAAALPAALREEFPRRTGLPVGPLATFSKLLHHRANGLDLRGLQWLGVPELVAWALCGERAAEVSLVARTGLLDQESGQVWDDAVAALGAGPDLLPRVRQAGEAWGRVDRLAPALLHGAVVTVAGHDHLVASVSAGVLQPEQLYDSMGTAEALVRVLDGPLDADARAELAAHEINVVRHLLPGRSAMLAGTKSGLLMRRVLQLAGVTDATGRAALDAQVLELGDDAPALRALSVTGASNDDGVLQVRADGDGLSPAVLLAATLEHGSALLAETLALMDRHVAPATESVVAGGWSQMESVRRSRGRVLPRARFADQDEATAFGAAAVGAFAADPGATDLAEHLGALGATTVPTAQPTHAGDAR